MKIYCVSFRKNTAKKSSSANRSKQNRLMLVSNGNVCGKKKPRFIRNPEGNRLEVHQRVILIKFKINKLVNKFLLAGDKFMPTLHLRQPGFTFSACGPFTKHRERILKIRKTDNIRNLHRNEFDKVYFTHDAAYAHSKNVAKRTISEKILKDRAYEIAKCAKYDGYQRGLHSMASLTKCK